jgi:hypothetical protein
VFRRLGLGWKDNDAVETVRTYQEEVRQFFWAFVLTRDDLEMRAKVLQEILEEESGIDALIFASNHVKDFNVLVSSHGQVPNDDFEIIRVLGQILPDEFSHFIKAASHMGNAAEFNNEFIATAYALALEETGHVPEEANSEDELFTPLPK